MYDLTAGIDGATCLNCSTSLMRSSSRQLNPSIIRVEEACSIQTNPSRCSVSRPCLPLIGSGIVKILLVCTGTCHFTAAGPNTSGPTEGAATEAPVAARKTSGAPTAAPTEVWLLSLGPTSAPTISQAPTVAPTRAPTAPPTFSSTSYCERPYTGFNESSSGGLPCGTYVRSCTAVLVRQVARRMFPTRAALVSPAVHT